MPQLTMRALLSESPVRLAPMASFTNAPFRAVARACGSGLTTNEEIDAEALLAGSPWAVASARSHEGEIVAMQLLGNGPDVLVPAARRLVDEGAAIIDINMGCPVPKIVNRGKGAALMRDVTAAGHLLAALRRAIDVPLTIKIRGGWDESRPNAVELARVAEEAGVDGITVHPRTRAQRFAGLAQWDVIRTVVEAVHVPVTGNGDVTSLAEARQMMAATGCVAVMVGRAALGRPWLFDPGYEALDQDGRAAYESAVIDRHLDLIEETMPPAMALLQSKKHLAHYGAGRENARILRAELFAQPSLPALRATYARQRESAVG